MVVRITYAFCAFSIDPQFPSLLFSAANSYHYFLVDSRSGGRRSSSSKSWRETGRKSHDAPGPIAPAGPALMD